MELFDLIFWVAVAFGLVVAYFHDKKTDLTASRKRDRLVR